MSKPRQKTKRPQPRGFKLSSEADGFLISIANRHGWSMTTAVEKSLAFAASSPDFGKPEGVR